MKKLFTIAAALLASISLWAVDPTYESYDWQSQEAAEAVAGNHDGIVISYAGLGSLGNVSGHWYIPNNQNLKNSDSEWKYFGIAANAQIDSVAFLYCPNGSNKTTIAWAAWGKDVTPNQYVLGHGETAGTTGSKSWESAIWETIDLTGIEAYTVYMSRNIREFREIGGSSNIPNFGGGQTINILGVRVWTKPSCEAPETALSLSSDANETVYVGDVINLTISGGNGALTALTLDGEAFEGTAWTATAGEHTFVVSQAQNTVDEVKYCAQEAELVFDVLETTPVTAVEIEGAENGYIGIPVTLTATAANADTIWWTNQSGQVQPSKDGVFTFTPDAAGDVTYTAWAQNQFNLQPVTENHTVTITKLCGELIKSSYNAGTKTSTVTGIVGGESYKKIQDNGKLGSNGHYYGVKLAAGAFMPGDTILAVASLLNGGNTATFYADKGVTSLGSAAFDTTSLTAVLVLKSSADTVYLYRKDSGCNPNIASLSVTRPCAASSNANIVRVYAQAGEEEQEFTQLEDTFFIEVPQEVALTSAPVHFVLEHPLAKINVANPLTMNVPAIGDAPVEQVVVVTAENGDTKNYTIRIIRRVEASHDATLKSLAITGFTLVPAFNPEVLEYTITKAYHADSPGTDKIVDEENDAAAHADKSVSTAGDTLFVTVTAEDNTTVKVYKIAILEDAAKKLLFEVEFNNGVLGYIEGDSAINVPYLAGTPRPAFLGASLWNADSIPADPTIAVNDDTTALMVTGADGKAKVYPINYIPLAPMSEALMDSLIVFDTVPNYIYSVYGWDATKGVKFAKRQEEASNHRISAGKDRICIALPPAKEVRLTSGTSSRDIRVCINRTASFKKTGKANETLTLKLDALNNNFIVIESNNDAGDGGFTKMEVVTPPVLYEISWDAVEDGIIGVEATEYGNYAEAGDTITMINFPDEGYELDHFFAYKTGDPETEVELLTDSTFKMPAFDVTFSAVFKEKPTLYTVTLGTYEHGTVQIANVGNEDHKFYEGDTVRLIVEPAEGFELEDISLEGIDLALQVDEDGNCAFAMPGQDVTVLATFKQEVAPVIVGYEITIDDDDLPCVLNYNAEHVQDSLVAPGTLVTITCEGMDEGFRLKMIKAYKTGDPTTIVEVSALHTFTMPEYNVTVTAEVEEIPATPTYKITIDGETENGVISVLNVTETMYFEEGAEITLTNVPEEGYELDEYIVYKTGDPTTVVTVTDSKFSMPAYDVTVSGTFKAKEEGIDDINADAKAIKRMINGVLVIEKNGKFFNAQGAELK